MPNQIVETVEIAAPAERVFQALTTPAELLRWWGDPAVCPSTHWEIDLTVGGKWLSRWRWAADGAEFALGGEVLELDPPRLLAYSWWDERYPGLPPTTVRYELEPIPGGVRLRMTHAGFAGSRPDFDDYRGGWPSVVAKLAAWVRPPYRSNADLAIHVPDLARAEAFYGGVLGFAVRSRSEGQLELDTGTFTLWVNRDSTGPRGFIPSLDVPDLTAARLHLARAGAGPIAGAEHAGGFYIRDPFGFPIDLIERAPAPTGEEPVGATVRG